MNIANKLQHNPSSHLGEFGSYTNTSNFNAPNLLKWSDCPYDTPYATAVNPSAQSTHQLQATYNQTNLSEEKMKKVIAAPVTDFKSLPIIQTGLIEKPVDDIGQHTTIGAASKWDRTMLYNSVCEYVRQEQLNCSENISPNLSSSGTVSESTNITLANHSKNSGFIEVSPSSASITGGNSLNRDPLSTHSTTGEMKQQSNTSSGGSKKFPRCMQSPTVEEENLLTSERTHFCPIKQTYSDGYSFEIPSNLDEIHYTRSASGSLYLDADKYMEYNPICSNDDSSDDGSDDGLVLKFCVRQIEKCCQTDANSIDQHYMANRFAAATKQRTTSNCTTTGILSPDIEMDYELRASFDRSTNEKDSMGNNLDMESWTMGEIKQKCLNNNNSHALWEHCSACECDIVSVPANRFLKDELKADGDEIMSDLKYMQNLYIGSDWEDDDCADEDDNSCQPLEPEVDCNDNDLSATEPDVFFYNVGKLLSDFLTPQTAKSFAHAFGHSNGNTVLEEIVLNDSNTKLAIPAIDSRASIWATAATGKLDSGESKIANTNLSAQQPSGTAAGFLITTTGGNIHQCMDIILNDNNNNDEISNNNNISEKYVGGLWSNVNDSIWRDNDQQQPKSTKQIAQQTNDNIWSTKCVNAKSVAAANNSGTATIAATTTTTTHTPATFNATGTVAAIVDNAISSWGEKQHWEHSYLEEIWKTENENVVKILDSDDANKQCVLTPIMVQSEDNNYADISRSGGGGNSGGVDDGDGRNDGSSKGVSDDVTALKLFAAAAHEHSYDLSNETLRQLKLAKKILSHEDGSAAVVMASISSSDNNKQTKLNRYDRKRRHSASQNITNMLDPFATAFLECDTIVGRKISSLYDGGCPKATAATALNVTTIITCNYWTTDADATAAAYFDNYNNKGMNSITTGTSVVNPSLILKNMPMASRPLTR